MEREVFNLRTRCGNVLILSWIEWSTHDSKSLVASILIFWSLADSNLSWQTISDLFNLSCDSPVTYTSINYSSILGNLLKKLCGATAESMVVLHQSIKPDSRPLVTKGGYHELMHQNFLNYIYTYIIHD